MSRTYQYDGDGNDPTAIGQVVTVVTNNPAPAANQGAGDITVTEAFTHDADGRVASVAMTLAGAVAQSGTVTYRYNNLNEPTTVGYPRSAEITDVLYSYDDQGRVIAIGSAAGTPSDIAAYTYSADGQVQTEARNGGALSGAYQYASPGWLQQQTETVGSATTPCFALAYTYNIDATMATRTMKSTFGSTSQITQVAYAYDGQRRLTDATVADGQPGNESVGGYDANGNIWSVTQDGSAYTFTCASGSDRLQSAKLAGTQVAFQYSADGWLTQGNGYATERDPCLGRATNLAVSGNKASQVRFAYGAAGQRVLKQVRGNSQSTQVYFYGSGRRPLASVQGSAWAAFVTGPNGLVAAADTARYFPLRDWQGTVWAVVDDQGTLVAQYDYLPFGGPLGTTVANPNVIGQRFMGQALDVETGLYNFQARLYDPVLRRFCSPDPAGQFASPYVFVGNDPLTMIDPSGDLSTLGWVSIGVMTLLTVTNIVITLATFGAAAPGTIEMEEGEAVEETALLTSTQTATSETATSSNTASQGLVRASWASFRVAGGRIMANRVGRYGVWTLRGALSGAERAGFQYDFSHRDDFSAAGFLESVGIGTAVGIVAGIAGSFGSSFGVGAARAAIAGVAASTGAGTVGGGLAGFIRPPGQTASGTADRVLSGTVSGLLAALVPGVGGPAGAGAGYGISAATSQASGMNNPSTTPMVDHVTNTAVAGDAAAIHATTSAFLMSQYHPRKHGS